MAGMPYPPKCVLGAVHLCSVGAAETAAPPKHSVRSVHSVGEYSTTPGEKHKEGMAECHALLFVIFAWLLHPIGGYCKPFTSSIDKPEPCATCSTVNPIARNCFAIAFFSSARPSACPYARPSARPSARPCFIPLACPSA